MKIYKFALGLIVILVGGCAVPATSVNSLRGGEASEYLRFDSDKSYLLVYETIVKNGKKCWNLTEVGMVVENELSEADKQAAVIFSIKEPARIPAYYIAVDIKGGGDSKTSVSVYHRGRDRAALAIKDWVENGSDRCS